MMKLKPVKNDRELNRALKRVDELWGAKPGTPKGDELDVLMLLVEKYENEHFAIPASDPVEAIEFLMLIQESVFRTSDKFPTSVVLCCA